MHSYYSRAQKGRVIGLHPLGKGKGEAVSSQCVCAFLVLTPLEARVILKMGTMVSIIEADSNDVIQCIYSSHEYFPRLSYLFRVHLHLSQVHPFALVEPACMIILLSCALISC